jgi:KDO2-lipid IV(A) lauroyltransferase
LGSTFSHDSALWRKLAYAGARYGPSFWVRYSPGLFGAAFALLLPRARREVEDTLRWVQGEDSSFRRRREVLGTFASYAHCLAEALASGRPEAERPSLRVSGEQHLTAALARGAGAIVVTAHAGPWDALARVLRKRFGLDVMVVMEAERDAQARGLHDSVRASAGVNVVHVGDDPMLALALRKQLEQGGVVALQLDRGAPSGRALRVRLFGRAFSVPEGPFRLAAVSGAPIVPVFARRAGYFEYDVEVHPAIDVERAADRAALELAAGRAAQSMQDFIGRNPTQWFRFGAQMP